MLSPADAELVARDRALPGLGVLLDPAALCEALARTSGEPVEGVELDYLRYKPGTNCVAAFRAKWAGAEQLCHAKAYGGDAARKLEKAVFRGSARGGGEPPLILGPQGIAVFRFPTDAKLPALARLGAAGARHDLVRRVFRWADAAVPVAFETLAYKPERRWVGRFSGPDARPAVLRFHQREHFAAARRTCGAFSSRERLRIAEPRGGSKRHAVIAVEWLEGRNLRDVLRTEAAASSMLRVGGALAELHAQDAPALEERPDTTASDLAGLCDTLAFLCPELVEHARRVAADVTARLAGEERTVVPIHGDLYDKQILLDGACVGLVDLDRATRGDPRLDLGLLVAHLERDATLGRLAPEKVEAVEASLLEGYQSARGARVGSLDAFVAEGLLRLAHHPFRSREPDWPAGVRALVDRATARLARASR